MGLIDRRIGVLFIAFVALLGIALARATYLGSVRAGTLERAAATQQVSNVTVPAPRGAITDANGAELAISQSADDVVADPYLIKDAVSASAELSSALGMPRLTVLGLITKRHTGYVLLAHLVPTAQATAIANLHIAGINLIPQTRRVYPRGNEAAQVVGMVHAAGDGASGIEYRYNNVLEGSNGLRRVVSDAIGQPISIDDERPTDPGKTVDAHDRLWTPAGGRAGAGAGGHHVLAQERHRDRGQSEYRRDPRPGQLARGGRGTARPDPEDLAIGLNYEPGSTFKAITVAGALQDGVVSPNTQFDIPPVLQVADRQIHDAEDHGYETLSVARSSSTRATSGPT